MYRKIKLILGPLIIIATIALFIWYLSSHPVVLEQLKQTNVSTAALLIGLYFGVQAALALVLAASLVIYNKHMGMQENFLLNAYSSLVNFFGPGQSGPGFRAVYLKVKHSISVKQYAFVTLIYYAFYALFSGTLLLAFTRPWWQTLSAVIAIAAVCFAVIKYFSIRHGNQAKTMKPRTLIMAVLLIGAATLLQTIIMCLIYYVELHSLDSTVTLQQAIAYTGAANFAIFVALTPGAIGIREAFLFSSESIHGISQSLIVAANVLDRAIYLVFLGLLFLIVLSLHANKKLQVKKIVSVQSHPN